MSRLQGIKVWGFRFGVVLGWGAEGVQLGLHAFQVLGLKVSLNPMRSPFRSGFCGRRARLMGPRSKFFGVLRNLVHNQRAQYPSTKEYSS